MKKAFRSICRLGLDDDGSIMAEYIIVVAIMAVAAIWLNNSIDAALFGSNPLGKQIGEGYGSLEYYDLDSGKIESAFDGETESILLSIRRDPEEAYLAQLYISLARP